MPVQTPVQTIDSSAATRAMALNLADWHTSSVQHFGVEPSYTESVWWRRPGGSGIYLGALIHNAEQGEAAIMADLTQVREVWGETGFGVYDCFGLFDLSKLGFRRIVQNPWYLRPPGAPPAPDLPQGLAIEVVKTPQQLADFEWATWEGFEEADDPVVAFGGRERYSQHPLATLEDANMVYLNARLEGEVVSSVIIHATEDMLGVYGISTLMRFRRRGYASALMRAALALHPDLPMSVFPDPDSLPIYTMHGFERAGEIAIWQSQ